MHIGSIYLSKHCIPIGHDIDVNYLLDDVILSGYIMTIPINHWHLYNLMKHAWKILEDTAE